MLDIDEETLKKHYSDRINKKKAEGKVEIYQAQRDMLEKQPVMAIWLGKQHLEQADKQESKVNVEILPPIFEDA